jgi:serine/threonine protein kinase
MGNEIHRAGYPRLSWKHRMIGQTVSKYRIIEEIGRGAMGIVFKAQDTVLGRFVALKILAEKLVNDPEMLGRFEREGGAAAALNHPNICTVLETGSWQGRPYLAMELLTGQALDDRLAAGPIPAGQLIEIAIGITSALEAAHAIGVVHRDIKPANLFLTTSGTVKVLDFGLAKVRPPATPLGDDAATVAMFATRKGTILGTLAYMSPEQVCCEPLDGRADLYSLGVVLYELATGQLPGRGSATIETLPAGLGPIVAKLISRDAHMRYQTAREAREAFQRCAGIESVSPGAAGWLARAFRSG